ncbi:glycosyltransferase [Candidatus Villigracilis saccharophilus]|uniref:glycosyltransferase n=1 Tax=Candidatus Villigracilis saccharophilus TaxID=3140684 RepID=UPI003136E915|nr:glycosyltransferase [Anaerolineales bacterium]
MNKTLDQLYREHKGKLSDKWSLYLTEYDRLFTVYRNQPVQLLEIGVQNGGSLEIWDQYFPNAGKIIGCDINPSCAALQYRSSRIAVVTGDANSDEYQNEILQYAPTFDIIIDDGSHDSSDIVRSFARYFPCLNETGMYVAEDLHCSYWDNFEGGLHQPLSAMSFFKRLADILNHEHWRNGRSGRELLAAFCDEFGVDFDDLELARIHSIEFLNSLCVIKKSPPENNTLGKRFIVGNEELVTSGVKKYDGSSIHDFEAQIKDDKDLDVFALIRRSRELAQEKEQVVQALKFELSQIYASRAWRVVQWLRRIWLMVSRMERLALTLKKKISRLLRTLINHDRPIQLDHYRRIKQKLDLKKNILLINSSGLFDKEWYLANNPDVALSKKDAAGHYLLHGGFEGRDPGPEFSSRQYLDNNKDVKEARVNPLVHYLASGISEGRPKFSSQKSSKVMNVIFVSGEPHTPGHIYRVERYVETYRSLGIHAVWRRPDELAGDLSPLGEIQLLILWRTIYDPNIELIVNYAKQKQVKIVFDVDDLMFDVNVVDAQIIDAIRFHNLDVEIVKDYYLKIQKTMLQADICTCPTQTLSNAMGDLNKESFVLPNGYDYDQLYRSTALVRGRPEMGGQVIRIGYAGGTQTHQRDFSLALPSLLRLLDEYPDIIITVFGKALHLGEFPEVQGYQDRFEIREMVPLEGLIDEIARFDINIAPLEINRFCEAKSELKYFEAALVRVPTVASPTQPFKNAIQHGVNGFLAGDSADWYKYLKMLIDDASLRERISNSAFQQVLWRFSPAQRACLVYSFLDQIGLSYRTNFSEIRRKACSFQKKLPPFIPANQNALPAYAKPEKHFEHRTEKISKAGLVIPLFNGQDLIVETLDSMAGQTLNDLDLVIVDDRSTDGSLGAAMDWLSEHKGRFANCAILGNAEHQGPGASRNIGFDYLQTPWVMPVDAGNILLPECLAQCLKLGIENNFSGVYSKLLIFGEAPGYIQEAYGGAELNLAEWDPARLVLDHYIDGMALISKAAWARVGGYDGSLQRGLEDYDLWLKFAENGLFAKYVPDILAKYRVNRKKMRSAGGKIGLIEGRKAIMERHPWMRR